MLEQEFLRLVQDKWKVQVQIRMCLVKSDDVYSIFKAPICSIFGLELFVLPAEPFAKAKSFQKRNIDLLFDVAYDRVNDRILLLIV